MRPVHSLTTSPQRSDPLTWSFRLNLPFLLACSTALTGTLAALTGSTRGAGPAGILVATVLVVVGCLIIVRAVQANRPLVRPAQTIVPYLLGLACVVVSGHAHRGSDVPIAEWTGPLGLCAILVALVPYSPALLTLGYGLLGAAISAAVALWAYAAHPAGPVSIVVAGATFPLHVGVVGAVFSALVVASVIRWRMLPYDRSQPTHSDAGFADRLRSHGAPVAIDDDVLALLERVADTGRITELDRMDAAVKARGIRRDLASVADMTWLTELVREGRVVVADPAGELTRMTRDQRDTVQGIVGAALASPLLAGALHLELRSRPDGATAVALRMEVELPEGRRSMVLAPQFVSLKATVDDLEWDVDEELRMRFKLPPAGEA